MNDTPAILLTIGVPIAMALVLGAVVMSGRMPARFRAVIERGLAAVVYPAAALFAGWRALENWKDGDWFGGVAGMAFVGLMLALGFRALRQRRLEPLGRPRE